MLDFLTILHNLVLEDVVVFFLYTTNWNNFDASLLKIFCRHLKVKNLVNVVIVVVRFIGVLSSQILAVWLIDILLFNVRRAVFKLYPGREQVQYYTYKLYRNEEIDGPTGSTTVDSH